MPDNNERQVVAEPFHNAARAELIEGSMASLRDAAFEKELSNIDKGRAAGMKEPEIMASLHAVIG